MSELKTRIYTRYFLFGCSLDHDFKMPGSLFQAGLRSLSKKFQLRRSILFFLWLMCLFYKNCIYNIFTLRGVNGLSQKAPLLD